MDDNEPMWITASYSSGGGDCVEVARTPQAVLVRDSKDRGGPRLHIVSAEWKSFTTRIRTGEFG